MDYISDGSDFEVEYSSDSDSLSYKSVFSSDLIYQQHSTSACRHTKYKDFHGQLETSTSDDLDTDDFTRFDFNWKTDNLQKRSRSKFTGIGSSKIQHYFELFWDSNVWAKLVIETNKYAKQERLKSPPFTFAAKWTPVDVQTMKAFVGLCFYMGITRKPKIADHWKQKFGLFRSQVNTIMSRDRFQLIWRY